VRLLTAAAARLLLLVLLCACSVGSMINLGVITLLQHPDQLDALKKVGVYCNCRPA
jgi:hypothetical protein